MTRRFGIPGGNLIPGSGFVHALSEEVAGVRTVWTMLRHALYSGHRWSRWRKRGGLWKKHCRICEALRVADDSCLVGDLLNAIQTFNLWRSPEEKP